MITEKEIVLVEDNEDDARGMIAFLRANGTTNVRWIQDGATAAEFLLFQTDHTPRLVLLDLVLPSMDGIELFKLIRAEPEERNLTVIFLVSSLQAKAYVESLGLAPDGFLQKAKGNSPPCRL
jgi:DNA-binding response OmpR family regulator